MEIILEREMIRTVVARWDRQYPEGRTKESAALHALDNNTATSEQVEKIIGNQSWTKHICDECGEYAIPVIRFGKYSESNFVLCGPCIGKAAVLADAFAKLK